MLAFAAFRGVNRHGQLQPGGITPQVGALVVKHYAAAAGLDATRFAGHSLRAGLVTSAATNSVPEYAIQKQTRHKSTDKLRRYIREASLGRMPARASGCGGIPMLGYDGFEVCMPAWSQRKCVYRNAIRNLRGGCEFPDTFRAG
jgi:hypothetical protein